MKLYYCCTTPHYYFLFPRWKTFAWIIGLIFPPPPVFFEYILPLNYWGEAPISQSPIPRLNPPAFVYYSSCYFFALIAYNLLFFIDVIALSWGLDICIKYNYLTINSNNFTYFKGFIIGILLLFLSRLIHAANLLNDGAYQVFVGEVVIVSEKGQ